MESRGGEVRRIHIIYFLSHMGRVEHPHLIRVHHFNRNGVYLRDVKRWLADLRGKDMAEAFAWSYKRRYKTGYVWQDLLDDDLITPLSDNEYVIKGSEIVSTPFDHASYYENKAYILKKQQPVEVEAEAKDQRQQQPSPKEAFQTHPHSKTNTSTDISSEINEESPLFGSERSTVTNDSIKLEEEKDVENGGWKLESTSFRSTLLMSKKNKKKSSKDDKVEKAAGTPSSSHSSSSPSTPPFRKSKSYSSGASSMLRNLIGCGAADTNDEVFVMLNRANKTNSSTKPDIKDDNFQGEKLGGSARVYGATWNQQQQEQQQPQHSTNWKGFDGKQGSQKKKQSGFSQQKAVPAAFKPHCSQCGKSFKPEKLHSHMKSCRGMKALSKTAAEKTQSYGSMTSSQKESAYRHLLTN
ncbi:protein SOSEKI 1 isoform X2 [Corylus avellana]|uniref:protein SOSEKI 1 isoform X2 n=1 Tax=Corylus avellana TaxID=13451 RepID=UPI00286D2C26|nr:protein SOSEKI 1 isoform X2 [Corylus avellana]